MTQGIPLVPPQASTQAASVDALFMFSLAIACFFTLLIFLLVVYFTIRYRRRSDDEIPPRVGKHYALEITWTIVPFGILLVMFFWGAKIYADLNRPAEHALEIHVVGKQWMWKIEHPEGVREIDALHIPVGQPIKLVMASQDVIHDFFIPAFRVKQDIVPGSYVTEWFTASQPGEYHIFCAQYCGTDHSRMVGTVYVMQPAQYQAWLAGAIPSDPPASAGKKLFTSYGCIACHGERAPTMAGLYGSTVTLTDGTKVVADEQYLRESILNSTAKIVAGYPPVMHSYQGQISEEQLFQLIAYIKSLSVTQRATQAVPLATPATQPAPADQPGHLLNYPPAQSPYSNSPPPGAAGSP
jgi:cytochrome c oxidase subunit 2